MKYEEIFTTERTLSPNQSNALMHEILEQGWRCYASTIESDVDVRSLIDRFLASHARIPGIMTDQMLALVPLEVFGFTDENSVSLVGSLFMNGAVVTVFPPGRPATLLLFVSEDTADRWKYPDTGYRYLRSADDQSIEQSTD